MSKYAIILVICLFSISLSGQEKYGFEVSKLIDHTGVKNQLNSGTCWSFASLSFFESEMKRLGAEPVDLSELFIVRQCYRDKAEKFIRLHGHLYYTEGGEIHDVLNTARNWGLVPQEAYQGKSLSELFGTCAITNTFKQYVDSIVSNYGEELPENWLADFDKYLISFMGEYPTEFTYKDKKYTPKTFASEVAKIKPEDYYQITSFSHKPYYSKFVIELPDNWSFDEVINVPLDEMKKTLDQALEKGYTAAVAIDVTEAGFSTRYGIATLPDMDSNDDKFYETLEKPHKEKDVNEKDRQKAYDVYKTTDDHGMHIVGTAKDKTGKKYYIVKNSWGTSSGQDGFIYISEAYFLYKAVTIVVHKDALSKNIKTNMKIQ